jgi:hypothetical protein
VSGNVVMVTCKLVTWERHHFRVKPTYNPSNTIYIRIFVVSCIRMYVVLDGLYGFILIMKTQPDELP